MTFFSERKKYLDKYNLLLRNVSFRGQEYKTQSILFDSKFRLQKIPTQNSDCNATLPVLYIVLPPWCKTAVEISHITTFYYIPNFVCYFSLATNEYCRCNLPSLVSMNIVDAIRNCYTIIDIQMNNDNCIV